VGVIVSGGPAAVPSELAGFTGDWVRGSGDGWLPRHPARTADWDARIAELAGREPAPEVWERAARDGERLGADEASRQAARALAAGEALCVTTGQQPGLFLGPLYTVYKAMSALVLARELGATLGRPVVPVFWNAADDSDFAEIGITSLPDEDLRLTRHKLDGGELPAGGMVGDLGTEGTRRALDPIRASFAERPGGSPILRHLDGALERAADHGELTAALLQDLFRGTGLVVVDGRWPELRRAAAPLFRRWAERRAEASDAVVAAGIRLEEAGYRAPIKEESTRNGLFDSRDGRRLPFDGTDADLLARIDTDPETLSPNVMLRPLVQDSRFPNVATIGGPSEIAYHAQLADEYRLLDVTMPLLVPRFEATLVPEGVRDLAARRGEPVEHFVRDFDAAMRRTTDRALPAPLRDALTDLEASLQGGFERVRAAAADYDSKLESAVPDAERRAGDAVGKLREKITAAVRAEEVRRDPAVKRYRDFLRPRGVPQERVLSGLTLFLESEAHPLDCLRDPISAHLAAVKEGRPLHWLLDFGGCREGGAA
jgi:bacillithiol biosynthesis cysteine-adding enzyme BshC